MYIYVVYIFKYMGVGVGGIRPGAASKSWIEFDHNFAPEPLGERVITSLIAGFMGPTWGPPGADRTQVGPMWAP